MDVKKMKEGWNPMKDKKAEQIDEILEDPFEEYIKLGEPDKAELAYG